MVTGSGAAGGVRGAFRKTNPVWVCDRAFHRDGREALLLEAFSAASEGKKMYVSAENEEERKEG